MPIPVLDAACSCDDQPQSSYGPINGNELVVRVLTDQHYKGARVQNSAFRVSDIISDGISLVRLSMVDVTEFYAVAEEVRRLATAEAVKGALSLAASSIRALLWEDDGSRKLCLFDDPIIDHPNERDNPAHCMAVCPREIDQADALEIRHELLNIFSEARYLHELWPSAQAN